MFESILFSNEPGKEIEKKTLIYLQKPSPPAFSPSHSCPSHPKTDPPTLFLFGLIPYHCLPFPSSQLLFFFYLHDGDEMGSAAIWLTGDY
jgi:hypothetical protein